MGTYYLDIETTGLNPESSKIVTIQYQKLNSKTGVPLGPLFILKEWEDGESKIIERLIRGTLITSSHEFDCVPIGNNLRFEHKFLNYKSKQHGLPTIDVADRPLLDLHPILVLMNYGNFRGSGLDKMTGKKQSGRQIAQWYEDEKYNMIVEYITDEAAAVVDFVKWLYQEMPALHRKFMQTLDIQDDKDVTIL